MSPIYLARVLEAGQDALFQLIDEAGHGTRRLPTPALMSVMVPVPPLQEQRRLEDEINSKMERVNVTVGRAKREIELIQEYRTHLISDVVTGKLDVRGVDLPTVDEVIDFALEESESGNPKESIEVEAVQ